MNVDLDVVVITISPQKLEVSGIYLETVVLTVVPKEFFSGTLVVYLGDYTGVSDLGDAYGDPGVLLTVKFPTIATPLDGHVHLSPLVITITPIDIQPYQPRSTCELTGMLDRLRLDGWAGAVSGDMTCELSSLLNFMRTGLSEPTYSPPIEVVADRKQGFWIDSSEIFTFTLTDTASNHVLIVFITYDGDRTCSSVKWNGVDMTYWSHVHQGIGGGGDRCMDMWTLVDPDLGIHDLEITIPSNDNAAVVTFLHYTGCKSGDQFGDNPVSQYNGRIIGSIGTYGGYDITCTEGDLVIDHVSVSPSASLTGGLGEETYEYSSYLNHIFGSKVIGSATLKSSIWTSDIDTDWAQILLVLKGNSIAPSTTYTPVGDSNCSLSELTELILTEYNAPPVSSIASHDVAVVNLSFADNDGQGYVKVGAGDDRILLIFVAYHRMGLYPKPFLNSVTYGGTALTRLTRVDGAGGVGPTVEVFYMLSPPVGTALAEILLAYNSQWVSATAVWFSGVNQSNPFASTTYNALNSVQEISTIIGIGTGQYPLDFVACLDATCTMAPDDATQTVIANGVVGNILRGISHRNGQTGNKIFQWEKTSELAVSAFTHVAISLSPSSLSTVPLEVEEPTDDCELSWAVYDVINAIRGTVH